MKTPKQKWQTVHSVGTKLCETIGIKVFTDMKNDWYSYCGATIALAYMSLIFYTIWFYFTQGRFLRGTECTYTAGIVTLVWYTHMV